MKTLPNPPASESAPSTANSTLPISDPSVPDVNSARNIAMQTQTTTPLLAHAIGHTITRAVVGEHELGLQFPDGNYCSDDYVSSCSDGCFVDLGIEVLHSATDSAVFLNDLCIDVAGYVGETVFANADSTLCLTGPGGHRVGRSDLVEAASECAKFACTFDIPVHEVLEACMEVVDITLRKYEVVADRMFRVLLEEDRLEGYRLAALLAEIHEEDLSLLVRQRLGLEMGE